MSQESNDYEFSEEEGEMLGLDESSAEEEEFAIGDEEPQVEEPISQEEAAPVPEPAVAVTESEPISEAASGKVLNLANDVPVQLAAVLAKKALTVKDLLELKMGEVVDFNRFPNEAIDLVANGKLFAKGELVEIDGKLGVRVIKVVH